MPSVSASQCSVTVPQPARQSGPITCCLALNSHTHEGCLFAPRFFSMLVQRSAKMHRRKGGGSLTLLLVLAGRPATGQARRKPNVSKYQHLSPELKAKLEAALESQSELLRPSTSGARTEARPQQLYCTMQHPRQPSWSGPAHRNMIGPWERATWLRLFS